MTRREHVHNEYTQEERRQVQRDCVRTRGMAALKEPANEERLSRCDEAAMEQIHVRIERMRQKGLLP